MPAAESLSLEKEVPTRSLDSTAQRTISSEPAAAFDPFAERLLGGAPAGPSESAASSLTIQRLKAPVLQRAQRLYGNRASQQVVMRARVLQRQCTCGGTCAKCQNEEEGQRALQRNSAATAPAEFDAIPAGGGEPLDARTRNPLETHFAADLSDVRVHTGTEASDSATKLDALAYTSGRDIYFAPGMYAPASDSGRRLLAHEVAHVVQQGSGKEPSIATKSSRGVKIGAPDDPLEREADQVAEAVTSAGDSSTGSIPRFLRSVPARFGSGNTVHLFRTESIFVQRDSDPPDDAGPSEHQDLPPGGVPDPVPTSQQGSEPGQFGDIRLSIAVKKSGGASDLGHAWVMIEGQPTRPSDSYGFWPQDMTVLTFLAGGSFHGLVHHPDTAYSPDAKETTQVDSDQLGLAINYANSHSNDLYNLVTYNCVDFARGMYASATGDAPSAGLLPILEDPDLLENAIEQRNKERGMDPTERPLAPEAGTPPIQRKCVCGGSASGECAECQKKREEELPAAPVIHRRSRGNGGCGSEAPPIVHEALRSPGQPLDESVRPLMESRFGRDFSDVRVHTDSLAAESAQAVNALAYAAGHDIYFAAGMYSPASSSGQRLLAHEVAHVVQQGSGKEPSIATKSSRGVKIGAPDDMLEGEADRAAEEFMSGTPGELTDEEQRKKRAAGRTVQTLIQRQDDGGAPAPAPETSADPVDRVIAALQEPQESGVGNYPAAFAILNGLWIVDMLHRLEQLRQRGYYDLLHDNSPEDMPRVRVAIAAVAAKGTPAAQQFPAQNPAFGSIEESQQHEVATYLGLPWPIPQTSSGGATTGEGGGVTTGEIVAGVLVGAAVIGAVVFFIACPECLPILALIASTGGEAVVAGTAIEAGTEVTVALVADAAAVGGESAVTATVVGETATTAAITETTTAAVTTTATTTAAATTTSAATTAVATTTGLAVASTTLSSDSPNIEKDTKRRDCLRDNPWFIPCEEEISMDEQVIYYILNQGYGYESLGECKGMSSYGPNEIGDCNGAPGENFHCDVHPYYDPVAREQKPGGVVSVFSCKCCRADGTVGVEFRPSHWSPGAK